MTKARQDGFYLLLLGSIFFAAIGSALEVTSPLGLADFKQVYYGARCAMQHGDAYRPDDLMAVYQAEAGAMPAGPAATRSLRVVVSLYTNLPTALLYFSPLAVLPWKAAAALWMILTAGFFLLASFLMWQSGARDAPRITGALLFLFIANSELLLSTGNAAGLVVSLSVIAVWCFVRERFVPAGILCLAVGLAIKPHDAGLVWFYFLLAGGVERKRALQTLALAVVLVVPAILWVSHVAPHWPQELHANLSASMVRGGRDDPGPASLGGRGIGPIVSLQTIASLIKDDPRVYNPPVYILCGALLLVWSYKTVRSGFPAKNAWFALAAISALTMLPFYHRTYDARLLLLTIPACAMLWKKGGPLRWWALLLNIAGIVLTGDLFWIVLFNRIGFSPRAIAFEMFPAPLALVAVAIFYLIVYVRQSARPEDCQGSGHRQIERPLQAGTGADS